MINSVETLEQAMANMWAEILQRPEAKEIGKILTSGDRTLYALWLTQVAHLTRHTSAHQALVGTRFTEISHAYAKFCFEHAAEEVGHEMMALSDLRKIGLGVKTIEDLPAPLLSTQMLTDYLYEAARHGHPATRLGFSFWAEKCYPYIDSLAGKAKSSLGLSDQSMSFFVSHATIDEKHAVDVERIVAHVCQTESDWSAVSRGMVDTLNLAIGIFEEIHQVSKNPQVAPTYRSFLSSQVVNA